MLHDDFVPIFSSRLIVIAIALAGFIFHGPGSGNSMGLILDARGSLSSFSGLQRAGIFAVPLFARSYGPDSFSLLGFLSVPRISWPRSRMFK